MSSSTRTVSNIIAQGILLVGAIASFFSTALGGPIVVIGGALLFSGFIKSLGGPGVDKVYATARKNSPLAFWGLGITNLLSFFSGSAVMLFVATAAMLIMVANHADEAVEAPTSSAN